MKIINPVGVKLNTNENISLKNVNLESKMSKYHQVTFFMSKIGKITMNYFYVYYKYKTF